MSRPVQELWHIVDCRGEARVIERLPGFAGPVPGPLALRGVADRPHADIVGHDGTDHVAVAA
eukprot:5841211-Prymnesium_polylepis.2